MGIARVGKTRPGGRTERTRVAVHQATLRLLAEHGVRFGVEDLAREAAVHKTTIYRRWPDLADLLGEVAAELIGQAVRVPDTGGLETDLRMLARDIAAVIRHPTHGPAMVALFTAPSEFREVHEVIGRFWSSRLALLQPVTDGAVARGELPDDTDTGLLFESLGAPLYYRLFLTRQPVNDDVVERAVQSTLLAAAGGVFQRPMPSRQRT